MSRLTKHPLLYEPYQVGPVKLKNRLVTPPMLPCFATAEGVITTEAIAFAGRLAKCGAGLVIMGETSIDADRSYDHLGAVNLGTDKVIPKLSMMADEVHRYGAKISVELNHSGACDMPTKSTLRGKNVNLTCRKKKNKSPAHRCRTLSTA